MNALPHRATVSPALAGVLTPIKALVLAHSGLRFEEESEARLLHALDERLTALACDPATYLAGLRGTVAGLEGELHQLLNLLTINETYFFREPEQIQLFARRLAPAMLAEGRAGRALRVLSAGCSSGEEIHSLAIALREALGEAACARVEWLAGDIDSAALARARAGCYPAFSFRACPADLKARYFEPAGRDYRLRADWQPPVRFFELNLVAPHWPAELGPLDVVFFRNVSIYFDAGTRRAILARLAERLAEGGVLVVGSAEVAANDLGVLSLVETDGVFHFQRGGRLLCQPAPVAGLQSPPQPLPQAAFQPGSLPDSAFAFPPLEIPSMPRHLADLSPLASPATDLPSPAGLASPADSPLPGALSPPALPSSAPAAAADLDRARRLVREGDGEGALTLLAAMMARPDDQGTGARLLLALLLADRKRLEEAAALADGVLAQAPWCVDALLLRGICARRMGEAEAAARHFRQALYAHPRCWLAHYQLADLLRQRGEADPARRAWRSVLQLLGQAPDDHGLGHLDAAWLAPPPGEARRLCEQRLERLDGDGSTMKAGR